MVSENNKENNSDKMLTEEETALYDRQIRLWGVDSQKRLKSAKILIIGMSGFGAEIVKNIVLSGVKSVTMLDKEPVCETDRCAQFLIPTDAVGSKAEASLSRAQSLNPMVEVKAVNEDVEGKSDEFFSDFDIIVATGCDFALLERLNKICRSQKVKFIAGDVFGMFGYFFLDLMEHSYKKSVSSDIFQQVYIPLNEALNFDWNQDNLKRRVSKMDCSFFLMLVLQEFLKQYGRRPCYKTHEADVEKLKEIEKKLVETKKIPEGKVSLELLNSVFAQISPVCAILGGLLSQEIIRILSNNDAPINNFFFFNPERCCGFVETIS